MDAARGRLCRVRGCHEDVAHAAGPGEANARHRAANGPQLPIERELSEAKRGDVYAQLPARAEDSEGDRELEAGSFLAALCRREIDGDPTEWELEAGIADRSAHALSRFLHRRAGKPHHDQRRRPVRAA